MAKQIFIGGTGRSGTTVLYNLLQSHKEVHAFDKEMRFIIDYNGLINLIDALTTNYSAVQAREAVFYFEELMTKHFIDKYSAPYVGFEFDKMFGEEFYWKRLEQFLEELTVGSFYGSDYTVVGNCLENKFSYFIRKIERYYKAYSRIILKNKRTTNLWPHREMKHIKYFSDRSELCKLVGNFTNDLFMNKTEKENKSIWCEKTPSNVLNINLLYEIFPESHFVHIKRDPRGVIQSMQNQFWAAPNIEGLCIMMKQLYKRWFDLKEKVDFERHNYLEVKLESLASDYDNEISKISSYLDIDNNGYINAPKITFEKANYWQDSMSREDIKIVNCILKDEIDMMGYEL